MEYLIWISIFLIFLIVYPQVFWLFLSTQNSFKASVYIKLITVISLGVSVFALGVATSSILAFAGVSAYIAIKNRVAVYSLLRSAIFKPTLHGAWSRLKALFLFRRKRVGAQQEVVVGVAKPSEDPVKVLWPVSTSREGQLPVEKISDASDLDDDSAPEEAPRQDTAAKKKVLTKKPSCVKPKRSRKPVSVDVAVQAIRPDPDVDPRVESRMQHLESRIRLEELRSKSWSKRMAEVEKNYQLIKSRVQTQEILHRSSVMPPIDIEPFLSPGALQIMRAKKSSTLSTLSEAPEVLIASTSLGHSEQTRVVATPPKFQSSFITPKDDITIPLSYEELKPSKLSSPLITTTNSSTSPLRTFDELMPTKLSSPLITTTNSSTSPQRTFDELMPTKLSSPPITTTNSSTSPSSSEVMTPTKSSSSTSPTSEQLLAAAAKWLTEQEFTPACSFVEQRATASCPFAAQKLAALHPTKMVSVPIASIELNTRPSPLAERKVVGDGYLMANLSAALRQARAEAGRDF